MADYLALIEKFVQQSLSQKEEYTLREWILEDDIHKKIFIDAIKLFENKNQIPFDSEAAYQVFMTSISKKKTKLINLNTFFRYAAVIVVMLSIGYFASQTNTNPNKIKPSEVIVNNTSIKDNTEITIVLADGTTKTLSNLNINTIKNTKGNTVVKNIENKLVFNNQNENENNGFNEIFVPNGKILHIELSDGTKVWLNSGTYLKFPQDIKSSKDKRVVFLEGEAFFDVTSNKKKPFIVNSKSINIEVLGTEFNVSAYENDSKVQTTLVEGAIDVYKANSSEKAIRLSPGDQASYNKSNKELLNKKVNTSNYTSWINDKLVITSFNLNEILSRLERKYDVTIINNTTNLNTAIFKGEFIDETLEEILNTIALSANFKYQINDNMITLTN